MLNILACKYMYYFPIVSLSEVLEDWIVNLYEGICCRDLALSNCGNWLSSLYEAIVCMSDAEAWRLRADSQEGKMYLKSWGEKEQAGSHKLWDIFILVSLFLSLNLNWYTEKDQWKQKGKKYDDKDNIYNIQAFF